MGLLSDLGLAAARRMRARLGARGALRVLVPMIASSEPSASRAGAILVALECAIEVDDAAAIEELALWWAAEPGPASGRDVARLVDALIARRRGDRAAMIAESEVQRAGSAASHAVRAIAREAEGELEGAIADWQDAERGPRELAARARTERARLLAASPARRIEAASIAPGAPDDRARLIAATARLAASGRYARVEGLDALVELASSAEPAIARAAIRAACAHLDESGPALTEIERERIAQAVSLWPDPIVAARAAAQLAAIVPALEGDPAARSAALVRAAGSDEPSRAALDRARAVLSGDAPGPRAGASWPALALVAAIRRARDDEARDRLRELVEGDDAGAPAWTACWMALERPALRSQAIGLAGRLLATRASPPRGFVHLAAALERAGAIAEARTALARAHQLREPGAGERRRALLLRAAWDAARRGEREAAISALREAKEIAG